MPKGREHEYLGRGVSGLKGRPGITKDVTALTDKAKKARREKEIEDRVGKNIKRVKAGKKPRVPPSKAAEKIVESSRSPAARARSLRVKSGDMLAAANKVAKSGTGNKKAEATYRRLAKGYAARAAAVLKKGK